MSLSAGERNLGRYNRFLLLVAGLGGLLYGIDVGIIGGALPYLEATSNLTGSQLSIIVAAVLLGSVCIHNGGEKLVWDSQNLKITNDPDANKFLHYEYRKGWTL